jgi:hypothetical protein
MGTYFVSGDQYWKYNDYKGSDDLFSPRPIWNGMPSKIDGMFVWSNNYLYVFSGKDYYLVDVKTKALFDGYPQTIASFWKGVPNNIDAVFRYVYLCMFRESLFNIYKVKLTCSLICVSGCTGLRLCTPAFHFTTIVILLSAGSAYSNLPC